MSNSISLESVDYNHDHGTCMFTCVYCHKHFDSFSVPGIIRSRLCFTQSLIFPSLDKDDPKATVLNSFEKDLDEDTEFVTEQTICTVQNPKNAPYIHHTCILHALYKAVN